MWAETSSSDFKHILRFYSNLAHQIARRIDLGLSPAEEEKLDTTLAEVYTALGEVYLYDLWKFDLAKEYLEKALRINPNLAIAHYHYAWGLYLFGDLEGAIREHLLAQKYDPFNPLHFAWMGVLYYDKGQMDEAYTAVREAFEIQSDYPAGHFVLGLTCLQDGKEEEAIEAHQKLAELYPWWSWGLGYTYAVTGHTAEAEEIIRQLESVDPNGWIAVGLTHIYGGLGNLDKAFEWLNYEPHHAFIAWAAVQREYKTLWEDPRFEDFLDRLKLPD